MIKFFAKHQGKKTTEHMAGDIGIFLMIYRSGLQKRFNITEHSLHPPKLFVFNSDPLGRQLGVGYQHPLDIKARIGFHFGWIYPGTVFGQFKILAIAFIADQGGGPKKLDNMLSSESLQYERI